MPRITKVTTRTGDRGETRLASGTRVSKDSPRIWAYGTVDELNSAIGVALAADLDTALAPTLARIQNELFHLGSSLARESDGEAAGPRVTERHVRALEEDQAELARTLPPLENFVLPGGTPGAAHLHVARTVCRRAERLVVALRRTEPVPDDALRYLNRLGDLLFVMSRHENASKGMPEPVWDSRA